MNGDQLEERLDEILEAALSSRRTALSPARKLAALPEAEQQRLLRWLTVTADVNPELAFQCAEWGPDRLAGASEERVSRWFRAVLDRFDDLGLRSALVMIKDETRGGATRSSAVGEVTLERERLHLEWFIIGLGGRRLNLDTGSAPATDTETLFLPATLARFSSEAENRLLYRCMAALQWAFGRFGTFQPDLAELFEERGDEAATLYALLENRRLDAILQKRLPGLARRGPEVWRRDNPWPRAWRAVEAELVSDTADRETSRRWLGRLPGGPVPSLLPHHGDFHWRRALAVRARRLEREKRLFRQMVGQALAKPKRVVLPGVRSEVEPLLQQPVDGQT